MYFFFFFSSRRRHTRWNCDWSSDVCSSDLMAATGDRLPWPTAAFWPWLLTGALSQIVATGLMLLAMNDRSFVVTTAYLKTEAIQTAIFGFVFLGDHLTVLKVIA